MPTNEEGSGNEKKYDEWYPLLEKELGLVAKPDVKIISIGNKVGQFLSKMGLTVTLGRFLTLQVEPHATEGKKSRAGRGSLNTGSSPLGSTQSLRCSCSPNRGCERDREPVKETLTEQQTRLMFDYKVRFDRIREQGRSGWRHWQREWERRMAYA